MKNLKGLVVVAALLLVGCGITEYGVFKYDDTFDREVWYGAKIPIVLTSWIEKDGRCGYGNYRYNTYGGSLILTCTGGEDEIVGSIEVKDAQHKIVKLSYRDVVSGEICQVPINDSTVWHTYIGESYSRNTTNGEIVCNEGMATGYSAKVKLQPLKPDALKMFNEQNKFRAVLEDGSIVDFRFAQYQTDKNIKKLSEELSADDHSMR